MTFGSDTMINYHLSQKLKLIGRGKFNHLTITLTPTSGVHAPQSPPAVSPPSIQLFCVVVFFVVVVVFLLLLYTFHLFLLYFLFSMDYSLPILKWFGLVGEILDDAGGHPSRTLIRLSAVPSLQ